MIRITLGDVINHQSPESTLTRVFRHRLLNKIEGYKIEAVSTQYGEYYHIIEPSELKALGGLVFESQELAAEMVIADVCLKNDMIKFLKEHGYTVTKSYQPGL